MQWTIKSNNQTNKNVNKLIKFFDHDKKTTNDSFITNINKLNRIKINMYVVKISWIK